MQDGGPPTGGPPSLLRAALTSSCGRRLSWRPGRKFQPAWPSAARPLRYARASSRPHWSACRLSRATSGSSAHWRSRMRRHSGDVSPLLDTPENTQRVGSGGIIHAFAEKGAYNMTECDESTCCRVGSVGERRRASALARVSREGQPVASGHHESRHRKCECPGKPPGITKCVGVLRIATVFSRPAEVFRAALGQGNFCNTPAGDGAGGVSYRLRG